MKRATRCLIFLAVASSLLLFAFVPRYELLENGTRKLGKRQILPTATPDATTKAPAATTTAAAPTTTAAAPPTTSAAAPPTTTQANTPTQQPTTTQPTTQQQQPTTNAPANTPAPTTTQQQQQQSTSAGQQTSAAAPPATSVSTGTNSQGETETVTLTSSTSSSASASSTSDASNSGDSGGGGLGTGSIVGLSVAGGVAVIGIIAFFVWKFTRKRFADFDDNEAIKWPELNTHGGESISGHALPTNSTGRSGFGDDNDDLTRVPSAGHSGYANSVATTSTPDLYPGGGHDPYAVPPLPHLNPNQPYHDEPAYGGQNEFYDPYRGPVPDSMSIDGGHPGAVAQGYGGEAIPMTQMARTRSPGPQMSYDMGRASPQPSMGRQSPGPQMAYGGDDRSRSPGPNMGMVPGRHASPAPRAAYGGGGGGYDDGYGGR